MTESPDRGPTNSWLQRQAELNWDSYEQARYSSALGEQYMNELIATASDPELCHGISEEDFELAIRNIQIQLMDALYDRHVPESARRACLDAFPMFFRHCALYMKEWTQAVYMFWDGLQTMPVELKESWLRALEGQLTIDNPAYQDGALHGLSHYRFGETERLAVIERFLARDDIHPDMRIVAKAAKIRDTL
jgi:hypothetical protein